MYLINALHEYTRRPECHLDMQPLEQTTLAMVANDTDVRRFLLCAYCQEYSETHTLFFGVTRRNIIQNRGDGTASMLHCRHEFFSHLLLPVPAENTVSLYRCVSNYFQPEPLTEWFDDERNVRHSQNLSINTFIVVYPPILVLQLNRFDVGIQQEREFGGVGGVYRSQAPTLVQFDATSVFKIGPASYRLFAVCNHYGSHFGGHYTAIVYNFTLKRWLHFNDESVQEVDAQYVVSPHAYCLFFRLV